MTQDAQDQADELEVLKSIYGDDASTDSATAAFHQIDIRTFQFKFGDDGSMHSFVLQVTWPDDYPSSAGPQLSLDAFYNAHLLPTVKQQMLVRLNELAIAECAGIAATYTIVEYVRENKTTLLAEQPTTRPSCAVESIQASEMDVIADNERHVDEVDEGVRARKLLSKSQKRRMWDRAQGGGTDERERGYNWMDLIRHLSQTGGVQDE